MTSIKGSKYFKVALSWQVCVVTEPAGASSLVILSVVLGPPCLKASFVCAPVHIAFTETSCQRRPVSKVLHRESESARYQNNNPDMAVSSPLFSHHISPSLSLSFSHLLPFFSQFTHLLPMPHFLTLAPNLSRSACRPIRLSLSL